MGKAGTIASPDGELKQAVFQPLGIQGNKAFYESYISLRDSCLELSTKEVSG